MSEARLEKLRAAIATQRATLNRQEGAMESIRAQWLKDHGTDDPEKVASILANLEKELAEVQANRDALIAQAEDILRKAGIPV